MWKTTKHTVLGRKVNQTLEAKGVIVAPEESDSIPYRAEVLASGVEGVEVGDTVLYTGQGRTYAAVKFLPALGEDELINIHELCIVAVIAKGEPHDSLLGEAS